MGVAGESEGASLRADTGRLAIQSAGPKGNRPGKCGFVATRSCSKSCGIDPGQWLRFGSLGGTMPRAEGFA